MMSFLGAFDVYCNFSTKLIVPLTSTGEMKLTHKRITPVVDINGDKYYVFTPAITFLDANKIKRKDFICNVVISRGEILSAIDAIITNT
ncbi:CcdB family protein [Photorhabdus sp. APURE]|uniref:CcdB family protein n=1 Tax=Photorhabdus aballayi TaxID=2991723 RepID=UPI00223D01DD|nr:CcdB family protein [Photorhabdus aballayi]MCW7548249.1 CcdB family protein [Photorhabdus aballayi]